MPDYERLEVIGSFGLSCVIGFDILEASFGDGYEDSALVGSSEGTRAWKLVFKVLPGVLDRSTQGGTFTIESRADYLWDFFVRRKAEGNSSFWITCPRDNQDYLAKFVEHTLSFDMFMIKLFSTGLSLQQRRERAV
jgi:phage-related protein